MKKTLRFSCILFIAALTSSQAMVNFSMWGTHGAALDYDSGTGILTALTGRDPSYHWNKSSWERRTGRKAFFSTDDFLNQTVSDAVTSISWDHVSGSDQDAYFNIMVEDANGRKAILAPVNLSAGNTGFITTGTDKNFHVFEAEDGWIGTASTGARAATWAEVQGLTITNGPFTEFPDTLDGAATQQNDPVYQLTNWANWATESGSAGAHEHGFMITFGQSTGNEPPVVQISNIQINGEAITVDSNENTLELVPDSGPANFTTGTVGAKTTAVAHEDTTLTQLNVEGGNGSTTLEVQPGVTVTLDGTTATVGDGGEITGNGAINGSLTVGSGGKLSGTISITGDTTLGSGSTFAPGFSPGAAYSAGSLIANNGSTTEFEIGGTLAATGNFNAPVVGEFDQLFYDGDITFEAGAIIEITPFEDFDLSTMVGSTFDLAYADGTITLDNGLVLNGTGAYAAYSFVFTVLSGQTFQGAGSYDLLQVELIAVPEPSTYAAIFSVLAIGCVIARKRFRKTAA